MEAQKKEKQPINLAKGGVLWTIWNLTEAILLMIGGILAMVYSGSADLQQILLAVVGSLLIVGGALRILANFMPIVASSHQEAEAKAKLKAAMSYELVIGGSFELALGVSLITIYCQSNADALSAIAQFISVFTGVVLICAGVSFILFAVAFIVAKLYKIYLPILEMILGSVLIVLGSLVLVYLSDPKNMMQFVLIIAGIVLLLAGIGLMITTIQALQAVNAKKKAAKAEEANAPKVEAGSADYTTEAGKNEAPVEAKKDVPATKEDKPEDPKDDSAK